MADEVVEVTVTPVEEVDQDLKDKAIELPGSGQAKKFVPLGDLIDERREKKTVAGENATLKARLADLDAKWNQAAPYVQALGQRPDLVEHLVKGTAPSTRQEQPQNDHKAEEFAKNYELFDAQGRPDTARARRILDGNAQDIKAAVDAHIAPLQATTNHDKAEHHRRWAWSYVQSGQVSEEAYKAYIQGVPDAVMANPQAAQTALAAAAGQTALAGKAKPQRQADDTEPLETESPGRRDSAPTSQLSPAMKAVLAGRGKSAADFAAFEKRMNGRDTSKGVPLED